MKKIFAVLLTMMLLASSLVMTFAAPSPTTSAVIGGMTAATENEEIVISKENVEAYLNITHVYDAVEGTELYEVGEQLKQDDKINDKNLVEVLGEDFDNAKLIQLFTISTTANVEGEAINVGDVLVNEDGTYTIENATTVSVTDGKVVVRLDCPSVNEDMNIRLVQKINGQWVQAEHVRAFNGYVTFDFDLGDDLGSVWALTVDKVPTSPVTGESLNFVYFAIFAIAVLGAVTVTRKYRAHK